jgi:uncharacterized protein (TIGR03435 family)
MAGRWGAVLAMGLAVGVLRVGAVDAQQVRQIDRTHSPQSAEGLASFPVATIKPSVGDPAAAVQIRGNRFVTEGTTFVDLFKYAFNVHPDQLRGGPAWLRTEKFDVNADPETEVRPSSDEMKALVRELLVRRFHVEMRDEKQVLPVYALRKSAKEMALKKSDGDPKGIPVVGYSASGELEVGNATMANLATFLGRFVLDRPAVDATGIAGRYDLVLRWTPDDGGQVAARGEESSSEGPPGLFTAIKEQLGLKLMPEKANVDVFVVESAERPAVD